MAKTTYCGTGLLSIKAMTPLLNILLGGFALEQEDDVSVYLRADAETACTWRDIVEALITYAVRHDLDVDDDEESPIVGDLLLKIAAYLKLDNTLLLEIIRYSRLDCTEPDDLADLYEAEVDVQLLVAITRCLDDGHGAEVLQFSGAWTCSEPRALRFGGVGHYSSKTVAFTRGSGTALSLGLALDAALAADDMKKAAQILLDSIPLSAIVNLDQRKRVMSEMAQQLFL